MDAAEQQAREIAELRARVEVLEAALEHVDRRRLFRRSTPVLPAAHAPAPLAPAPPAPALPAPETAPEPERLFVPVPAPLPEPTGEATEVVRHRPPEPTAAAVPEPIPESEPESGCVTVEIADPGSRDAAVSGTTAGKGAGVTGAALAGSAAAGVRAVSAGTGSALVAQTTRPSNKQPAIRAHHAGTGPALSAVSARGVGATLQGSAAGVRLVPQQTSGAPTSGVHEIGELIVDAGGAAYLCTASGTPGGWRRLKLD